MDGRQIHHAQFVSDGGAPELVRGAQRILPAIAERPVQRRGVAIAKVGGPGVHAAPFPK